MCVREKAWLGKIVRVREKAHIFLELWVFQEALGLKLSGIGAELGGVNLDKVLVADDFVALLYL